MEQLLFTYYDQNAKKLRSMVDKMLAKFGGISDKDRDDFYSLANEVFVEVMRCYDSAQPFDGFLYACLCKRIQTEMTRRNRKKRKADRMSVSMDAPSDTDESVTIGDLIADEATVEGTVFGEANALSARLERYLARLSYRQRRVVALLAASYQAKEIQALLHLTRTEYQDALRGIHAYENISLLF